MVDEVKSKIQLYINDIPNTSDYTPYKENFESIMELFEQSDVCDKKLVVAMDRLYTTIEGIHNKRTEAAKHVFEIIMKHRNPNFGEMYKAGLEYSRHTELYLEEDC